MDLLQFYKCSVRSSVLVSWCTIIINENNLDLGSHMHCKTVTVHHVLCLVPGIYYNN